MGRPTRETVMNALFTALTSSVQTSFTANTSNGSAVLSSPSTTAGLFLGLPVVGNGIPRGAVIASLSPLTIDQPATASGTAVPLLTGFLTFSRRFQVWTKVAEQPALFLRDNDETITYQNQMQLLTMKAEIWIYTQAGQNADLAPITALNNLLDAIATVFTPDSPMQQYTIGGLVSWCRLAGRIEKSPGDLDKQAIAVADVEIFVP